MIVLACQVCWPYYVYQCSNKVLPQPISKRKDKEHKKKKSKTVLAITVETEVDLKTVNAPVKVTSYNTPTNVILDQKPGWLQSTNVGNECTRITRDFHFIRSRFIAIYEKSSWTEYWERKKYLQIYLLGIKVVG